MQDDGPSAAFRGAAEIRSSLEAKRAAISRTHDTVKSGEFPPHRERSGRRVTFQKTALERCTSGQASAKLQKAFNSLGLVREQSHFASKIIPPGLESHHLPTVLRSGWVFPHVKAIAVVCAEINPSFYFFCGLPISWHRSGPLAFPRIIKFWAVNQESGQTNRVPEIDFPAIKGDVQMVPHHLHRGLSH